MHYPKIFDNRASGFQDIQMPTDFQTWCFHLHLSFFNQTETTWIFYHTLGLNLLIWDLVPSVYTLRSCSSLAIHRVRNTYLRFCLQRLHFEMLHFLAIPRVWKTYSRFVPQCLHFEILQFFSYSQSMENLLEILFCRWHNRGQLLGYVCGPLLNVRQTLVSRL